MTLALARDEADTRQADVFLHAYLEPFLPFLSRPDVTELIVNKPGEVWLEQAGSPAMERADVPQVDDRLVRRLAEQVARITNQAISREMPLLAATLPGGERLQVVAPTATRGHWALAIRRHRMVDLPISAWRPRFDQIGAGQECLPAIDREADPIGWLVEQVRRRRTVLIAGGTSSGKTTFLNSLLAEIDPGERVILVEDTPEIRLPTPCSLGLVAVSDALGEARVDTDDLLRASLRLRPDRIVLGELRGREAVTFLRAINTGHPGSLSTIHANTASGALEQLALMTMQAGLGLSRSETLAYARSVIEIVVQLGRACGRRQVLDISETADLDLAID
ncbi:MAG: P-type DNA transfer ATPase VirB11 [Novosphingobium sp.]|nr:P-type DNA transfer ATPase VirB11 [Novosphingobium sp.]